MATYRELVGKKIKKVTSDPSDSIDGQMWYNSTTGAIRGLAVLEATRSATPMTNKRSLYGFGVGTGTAGLVVGGLDDSTYLNAVEEWNGSGWAAGGAYPTSRYSAGTAGTQTAAISYCGRVPSSPAPGSPAETYNYDGSSWTSGNSFPTGGNAMQGIGAVNTAVVSTEVHNNTNMYHWNGTSWTSANARNVAKGGQAAFGTQTAAVLAGGFPSESNITEVYDGTNWTSGNTMNTGRNQIAGSGTQTDGLAFGGDKPPSEAAQTTIESWDGTSWATSPATLATARTRAGTGRNTASGTWIAGGIGPGGGGEGFDATEIYEKSTNVITAAAWASGGALSTKRYAVGGTGTQTAGLAVGGTTYPIASVNATEEYGGATWTAGGNYPTTTSATGLSGTQTSAVAAGGFAPGAVDATCTYDGSSWTALSSPSNLNQARAQIGQSMDGTQTASILAGGVGPGGTPFYNNSETWNGSSWTATPNINTARGNAALVGTTSAAAIAGGYTPTKIKSIEIWNGSSWTTSPATLLENNVGLARAGSAYDSSLFSGGYDGSNNLTTSQGFDGTSVSTRPSIATARRELGGCGTDSAALIFGGVPPSGIPGTTTATEEFTGETSTVNIKNFTTS